jgi:hypothetical protein
MIREKVGHALNTKSLQSSAERERPVDVIGAMAVSSQLGSLLFRMKYGGFITAANTELAAVRLAGRMQPRGLRPIPMLVEIARLAVEEWLLDRCFVCNGRRMVGGHRDRLVQRRIPCKKCNGTGEITRTTPRGTVLTTCCGDCGGLKVTTLLELHDAEPLRQCHVCSGTGRLVMTDTQRARLMNVSVAEVQGWEKRLNRALDLLRQIDRRTAGCVRAQLAVI